MFKLFIVDDEPLVREGLRLSIEWENYGFTVVGEAANGMEALQKIPELNPDVLITDMRMNIMDGMDLIHHIKKDYPEIQIVILTAYNEFTYAKAAIDNDVFSYISKPARNEEIISVFCRLREKMEHNLHVQDKLQSYRNYRMDEMLSQLLQNPAPSPELIAEFKKNMSQSSMRSDFFVALIEIDAARQTNSPAGARHLSLILNERLNYYLSIHENCIYKACLSTTETALLIYTQSHDFKQQIPLLQNISDDFCNTTGSTLTIGVSATFRSLGALYRAYTQARKAIEKKPQTGPGKIIDFMSISALSPQTPVMSEAEISEIIHNLVEPKDHLAVGAITRYFDSLENHNADILVVKSNMIELTTRIIRKIFTNAYTLQLVFGRNIRPSSDIQAFDTISEIRTYVLDFIDKVQLNIQCMKSLNISREHYSPIVNKAVSYITSNYAKNIQIADVASQLHISESRLMHSFKEETGKSFYNFLTEYRIRLAEVMMKTGYYKLYEISELVGYQNPLTFRRAFSKIVGSIPSKYQKQ